MQSLKAIWAIIKFIVWLATFAIALSALSIALQHYEIGMVYWIEDPDPLYAVKMLVNSL